MVGLRMPFVQGRTGFGQDLSRSRRPRFPVDLDEAPKRGTCLPDKGWTIHPPTGGRPPSRE